MAEAAAPRSDGIATDASGNSYVTGFFHRTVTFGAGETNETVLERSDPAEGSEPNVFVAKYDRSGRLLWATQAGGTRAGQGAGIAVDPRGNSYVAGFFSGTATFGAGEDNEIDLTAASGFQDIFVAKYDRNGRLLWAARAGGTADDGGFGIAADARGNSYVTGFFIGTATFGAGEDNETELTTTASVTSSSPSTTGRVDSFGQSSQHQLEGTSPAARASRSTVAATAT